MHVVLTLLFVLMGSMAQAETSPSPSTHSTSAVMSPKCDEAKLKEISADALVAIHPMGQTGDAPVYSITLDTAKMTFAALTKKMLDQGCF